MTKQVPYIPDSAPFTAEQRLWLNGYLAGYFSDAATSTSSPVSPSMPLTILFGSQTGTSEGLARKTAKMAESRGFTPKLVCMEKHDALDLATAERLLVITSTYGDGEPPDNAQEFWSFLNSERAPRLEGVHFSVLALGDTNYPSFCQFGKLCDERLAQLGARRIHPRVDCDIDYDAPAKAWTDGVFGALRSPEGRNDAANTKHEAAAPADSGWSRRTPFSARLVANRLLTGPNSGKEVRHLEISLTGSGLTYEVGDALGVVPSNCPDLVAELLRLLGCDGEEAVATPEGPETSLRLALTQHFDITKPSADFLKAASERNPELAGLLDPARKDDLRGYLWGREIIDVLAAMSSPFPAKDFIALLKKLQPRFYSISSSPSAHRDEVHLTVGAVRYVSHGRPRKGVASTFLADRVATDMPVPVFVQVSHGFRLPANGDVPIIMCGAGTGIAPFRAFLEEREATRAKGRNWLIFGDQKRASDFLYQEQLETWLASGHLAQLALAFSRDQAEKLYVQHRMLEYAAELWAWLQAGAHFYVCGDAIRMAKDVDAALHRIAETAGGLSVAAAAEYVAKLKSERRYQRDVY